MLGHSTLEAHIRVNRLLKTLGIGVGILGIVAFLFVSLTLLAFAPEATPSQDIQHRVPVAPTCKTIPAKQFNSKLRVRRQITGNDQRFRSRPVCVDRWRDLLRSIKKKRRACINGAITTGATWYGGSGDSMTSGTAGAYGDLSSHPWSFAELGMGSAMGGLPPLSWWYVHSKNNGKTKQAQKRDIGGGGGPVNGLTRGFDAWHPLAQYLGLMGNGTVQLAKRNCWA